ncbi:MAG TPA: O-antigen ligase family protein [Gaiellaceae bacterium]|nr:O-antigen ligase family protein [Gaiellaceae bacterium]
MDAATETSVRALGVGTFVFAAITGGVLLGATFAGDGADVGGVLPVGGAAVVALAAALVAVAFGRLPTPRVGGSGVFLIAAAIGLTLWIGTTMAWSIVGDRSWDAFNKSAAYCAFLGLGIVLAAAGRQVGARLAAWVLSVVIGATLVWALVTKSAPALIEYERVARLNEPVEHWNALALLADIAIVLGLWIGTAAEHRRSVRVGGALLVYVATLALLLTLSRAGVVVGVGAVALWLVVGRERVPSGLLLLGASGPAIAVGAWAFTRPGLTDDLAASGDQEADGAVLGALTLVGALVVAVVVGVALRRSLANDTRRRVGRGLAALAVGLVLAAGAAVSVAAADAVSAGRDCAEVVNDPSRLSSLDPNLRLCWWEEAWDVFEYHGPEGAGAGTFEIARKRFRHDARNVVQPHSVPLQHLADGGVVGLGLFSALVLTGFVVCVCALRRLAGAERAAAAALVAAPAAYFVHALVDYNWDFLAVTAPTMVALGALASAGRSTRPAPRRPFLALSTVLVAAVLVGSFAIPRVADELERSSTRALADSDTERARDRALWARVLNPLSADPFVSLARVEERRGNVLRAEREYINAVELQPQNPATWYALGIFEYEVRGNLCATYRYLNNAYTLDPVGNQWVRGGPLDVARDSVNAGGCALGS